MCLCDPSNLKLLWLEGIIIFQSTGGCDVISKMYDFLRLSVHIYKIENCLFHVQLKTLLINYVLMGELSKLFEAISSSALL